MVETFLEGFGLPELWSFQGAKSLLQMTLFWLEVLAIIAVIAWLFYVFIWKRKIYFINVLIFSSRAGGNMMIGLDKGGYVKKDHSDMMRLSKRKIYRPKPPLNKLFMDERGGTWLFYHRYGHDDFTPITLDRVKELLEIKRDLKPETVMRIKRFLEEDKVCLVE